MNTKKIVYSALFIAIGIVLPFLTGQIPEIGKALLPMHLPVYLAGLILGPLYGLLVGLILPILRSSIFQMPPMPMAITMMFEMGTYGLVSGLIYDRLFDKDTKAIYISLIPAMILGRIIWGIAMTIIMGVQGGEFSFNAFLGGAIFTAIPGIILQLVLIPILMKIYNMRVKSYNP